MDIRAAQSPGLVPKMPRTNHGNETGVMGASNCKLRQNPDEHSYETSVANQNIENFWLHFRRTFTSWLVNFFKQMVEERLLEMGNHFHMQFIWFSFSCLLQFKLNNFAERWNTHHIRSSKPNCIAGVPDQLFTSREESYGMYIVRQLNLTYPPTIGLKQRIYFQKLMKVAFNLYS